MAQIIRRTEMLLCIMSLFVATRTIVTTGQQQQQQQNTDESTSCTNVILSLSPCLDYITGNAITPSSGCCSQIAYVVGSQPQCLCEVVNGGAAFSSVAATLNINQTLAFQLPTACSVQAPPISICTGSGSSSPPATGVSVSNIPNSPSGIGFGSNTVSSTTTGGRSGGGSFRWNSSSSTKLPSCFSSMFLFLLATTLIFTFMTTT